MMKRPIVKSNDKITADSHESGTDYLSSNEIKLLLEASKKTRYPKRNYLLVFMMYRHGLRLSEAVSLKRADVDLKESRI
ncbi:MAG: tyrosine-type recombinase/integrase [Bacteroidota bacterium]